MNCEEARPLVQVYLDDELDLTGSLEIERHVAGCAACRGEYERQQALKRAMSAGPLYYQAPAGLRKSVQATLRRENKAAAPRTVPWNWLGVAAALVLVAIMAWGVTRYQALSAQRNVVAEEALASSMRALMAGPLTDVQSSDQHTVKPWFAGKLDFSPVVRDFAGQGFPLAGGRLDYIGSRPVAALVYRHQQHVINLYTWPAPGSPDAPVQEHNYQGYNVFSWTQGGMNYEAVSDMDAAELRQFAGLVRQG